jgi:hypothetical protein
VFSAVLEAVAVAVTCAPELRNQHQSVIGRRSADRVWTSTSRVNCLGRIDAAEPVLTQIRMHKQRMGPLGVDEEHEIVLSEVHMMRVVRSCNPSNTVQLLTFRMAQHGSAIQLPGSLCQTRVYPLSPCRLTPDCCIQPVDVYTAFENASRPLT